MHRAWAIIERELRRFRRSPVLIMISLWFEWNFPSFVIEFFWALISIWGIYMARSHHRRRH